MAVERWFERKHSDLRGRVKNLLDRSRISVGSGPIRPRVWPQRRRAASSAGSCAMEGQGCGRPKKSEEGNSSAFFTQKGNAAPSPVFIRRVVKVLESEASALYIVNK